MDPFIPASAEAAVIPQGGMGQARPKTAAENVAKAEGDAAAKVSMPDPTAPVAPVTGKITVVNEQGLVAVQTKNWWTSQTMWVAIGGFAGMVVDAIVEVVLPALQQPGPIKWSTLSRPVIVAVLMAFMAWRRTQDNTVIRGSTATTTSGVKV